MLILRTGQKFAPKNIPHTPQLLRPGQNFARSIIYPLYNNFPAQDKIFLPACSSPLFNSDFILFSRGSGLRYDGFPELPPYRKPLPLENPIPKQLYYNFY